MTQHQINVKHIITSKEMKIWHGYLPEIANVFFFSLIAERRTHTLICRKCVFEELLLFFGRQLFPRVQYFLVKLRIQWIRTRESKPIHNFREKWTVTNYPTIDFNCNMQLKWSAVAITISAIRIWLSNFPQSRSRHLSHTKKKHAKYSKLHWI